MKSLFRTAMFFAVCVFLFTGCNKAGGLIGGGDVELVKNGYFEFDKSITVGQAFDGYKYFKNQTWKSSKTEQGRKIVTFTADIVDTPRIKNGTLSNGKVWVTFKINSDNTFEIFTAGAEWEALGGKAGVPNMTNSNSYLTSFLKDVYNNEPYPR